MKKKQEKFMKECRSKHVRKRLKERFNVHIEENKINAFLKDVCKNIQDRKALNVCEVSNSTSIYRLVINDIPMFFVYSKKSKQIKTVLTQDLVEKDQYKFDHRRIDVLKQNF